MSECGCGWKLPREWSVGITLSDEYHAMDGRALYGGSFQELPGEPVERAVVVVTCPVCGTVHEHDTKIEVVQ